MGKKSNLDWIKDIDDDELYQLLDRDAKLIYEYCDRSTLIDLLENLRSTPLYISKRPIERAQKLYIGRRFNGDNHKELAAKLDCSLQFVYETIEEQRKSTSEQAPTPADLFSANGEQP